MAVGALFTPPWVHPLKTGAVVPSSKLTFTLTGTGAAANTYSDSALTTPNANPVVADSEGVFTAIFLDPTIVYRVKWTTSADALIRQQDDVVAGNTVSTTYRLKGTAPELIFQETDGSANNTRWRINVNAERFVISVGNDAENTWVDALVIDRTANTIDGVSLSGLSAVSTFAPVWTGFSVAPTGNVSYYSIGSLVVAQFGALCTGTSNTTAMTITNVPSSLRPVSSTNPILAYFPVIDNNAVGIGTMRRSGASTWEFFKGSAPPSLTGWTNSSTKGFEAGTTLVFTL